MADNIEVIAQDNNRCGEGPIWDSANHRLIWTDIEGALVYEYLPATGAKMIISRDLSVAGIALNRDGRLVFAGAKGMGLWAGPGNYRPLLTEYEGQPLVFNDIIADPQGRIYAGTLYWGPDGMEKTGCLYLIGTDGSARVVDEGIEISNGLGFSPDDATLYYTDSAARKVYAYDVDRKTGDLSNRRVFASIPTDEGIPDGLTVDSDGFVWSAQWYGSQVVRYAPDGRAVRRIPMPVRQVSSVAFGGKGLADLYVTTAGESWPSRLAPPGYDFNAPDIGGSLYRVRLETPGRPEHRAAFTG